MSCLRRAAAIGIILLGASPAFAQSYGYGPSASPPPPPPQSSQDYPPPDAPPPPAYAPPAYEPPGRHCQARFTDTGQPLICRMRVRKPIGAPCRCFAATPPGYPPEPPVPGRVAP